MDELLRGLDDATSGRGQLVLLSGPPGIGKSRLTAEFAEKARNHNARVLIGRCWEAGGAPPYWPWVQISRTLLRALDSPTARQLMGGGIADIGQLLPELLELFPDVTPPPALDPESARFRLFDATAKFLSDGAELKTLILILEDLQAADTPSLLLLNFLAGQLLDRRILIIGTYRDVAVTPDHPLSEALTRLRREPVTRDLPLSGLGPSDVARFVEASGGDGSDQQLVISLHRQTNGNPLFLTETVRLLAARSREGRSPEPAFGRFVLPHGITEAITRRIEQLSESSQRALEMASVLGNEIAFEPVRKLSGHTGEDLLEALGEALTASLLIEVPGVPGRFRFAHDLIRDTLYQSLSPALRMRLHRQTAEILEEAYGDDMEDHLAELALHYFESAPTGDASKAADYAQRAGDQAMRALAYEEAVRLLAMGLSVLEAYERPDPEVLTETLLSLGEAQVRAGDLPGALDAFLRAAGIARRAGAGRQLARAALGYGGRFIWPRAGSDRHVIPLLQDALVLLGGEDDRLRVRLLTRLACCLRGSPDPEHGAALSQQALDRARALDDPSTLVYALVGRFASIWWPGNETERLAIAEETVRVGSEIRDTERTIEGHMAFCLTYMELGDIDLTRASLKAITDASGTHRQPADRWLASALHVELALLQGVYRGIEQLIDETSGQGVTTTALDNVSGARFQLFLLRREQGRVAEVEQPMRAAVETFTWYPIHRVGLICLLLDTGRAEEARSLFDELARERFAAVPRDNYWLMVMAMAGEACFMLDDRARAAVLYEQLLPFQHLHAVGAPEGALGSVARYLGLLACTLGDLDQADRQFEAAAAFNQAMHALPWVAHTQHDQARMLLQRDRPGDHDRARRLLSDCLEACSNLGMAALAGKVGALLSGLGDEAASLSGVSLLSSASAQWRREGEYFTLRFDGSAFRLRDSKGLRYLGTLLASPGKEIHVLDLLQSADGFSSTRVSTPPDEALVTSVGQGGLEVLDERARALYKERLLELERDLEKARSFGDGEKVARIEEERDFLIRELAGAMGLGGRPRTSGSAAERARVNVTRAIRASLSRIRRESPGLADHLEATIHTGTFCSYTPDPRSLPIWKF